MKEELTEALIQSVAATMASMGQEQREKLAAYLHILPEELDRVIENWKASRQ